MYICTDMYEMPGTPAVPQPVPLVRSLTTAQLHKCPPVQRDRPAAGPAKSITLGIQPRVG